MTSSSLQFSTLCLCPFSTAGSFHPHYVCKSTAAHTTDSSVYIFYEDVAQGENVYKYNKKCQYKGKIQLLCSNVTYKVPHLKAHILEAARGQVPDNLWVVKYRIHMNRFACVSNF